MSETMYTVFSERDRQMPFALYGVKMNHDQEHIRRDQGLPLYQWIQCEQGSGMLWLEGRQYAVKPGMGMYLPPGLPHSYCADDPGIPWIVDFVLFDSYVMERLCAGTPLEKAGSFYVNRSDNILQIIRTLFEEPAISETEKNAYYSAQLYRMILMLMHSVSATEGRSLQEKNHYVAPVIAYIEHHFHEPVYLDQLAAVSGLSQTYLCRVFKNVTGMCISDYIRQVRIRHSKMLLSGNSGVSVRQAGELSGFGSPSYFNKIFRETEGMSPGDFRKLQGV